MRLSDNPNTSGNNKADIYVVLKTRRARVDGGTKLEMQAGITFLTILSTLLISYAFYRGDTRNLLLTDLRVMHNNEFTFIAHAQCENSIPLGGAGPCGSLATNGNTLETP